jgi:hypothetical protein
MSQDDPNNGRIIKPAETKVDQSHTELHVEVNVDARGMSQEEAQKFTTESARAVWNEELRLMRANQKEVE